MQETTRTEATNLSDKSVTNVSNGAKVVKTTTTGTRQIEDIDGGLLRQRRNLLAISLGLLAFELGKGSLERANVLFGTLTLQRPGVVLVFAWVALAYSFWRYWLYSEPGATAFRDTVHQELVSSPAYSKLVRQVVEAEAKENAVEIENMRPVIRRQLFRRQLDFTRSIPIEEIVGPNMRMHEEATYNLNVNVRVPYWKMATIEWGSGLRALAKNRAFSDYYLPYLLAIAAGIVGVGRYFY